MSAALRRVHPLWLVPIQHDYNDWIGRGNTRLVSSAHTGIVRWEDEPRSSPGGTVVPLGDQDAPILGSPRGACPAYQGNANG